MVIYYNGATLYHGNVYHDKERLNIGTTMPAYHKGNTIMRRNYFSYICYGLSAVFILMAILCSIEIIFGHTPDLLWVGEFSIAGGFVYFIGRSEQRFKNIEEKLESISNKLDVI